MMRKIIAITLAITLVLAFLLLISPEVFAQPSLPDFGDARDPSYPSLLASNGARHLDFGYEWLGPSVNGEIDSKQVDRDEYDDGVRFLDGSIVVDIRTSGLAGRYDINDRDKVIYLNAWIDWDRDGDWKDPGDKVIGTGSPTDTQMFAGPAQPVYDISLPLNTWMRIRLDYAEDVGRNPQPWTDVGLEGLDDDEGEAGFGEVEDYIRLSAPPCRAEAAYGDGAPEVDTLRNFRDQYLLTNPIGKAFVDLYYKTDPPISEFITEHPVSKPVARVILYPGVAIAHIATDTYLEQKMAIGSILALVPLILFGGIAMNGHFPPRKNH